MSAWNSAPIGRKVVKALVALTLAFASSHATGTDFPAGNVGGQVQSVISCSLISGDGIVVGASAAVNGPDLDISIPAGGVFLSPATLKVTNIPIDVPGAATVTLTGAESLSGTGVAVLFFNGNSSPVAFSVTTSGMSGSCGADFAIGGSIDLTALTSEISSLSVIQEEFAISRTTTGVFVDATKAAGFALGALTGLRSPRSFQADGNGGSFHLRGLNAGDSPLALGVWGNVGYTRSDNDLANTASSSTRWHGTLGGDITLDDWLVVGMAAGWENDDTDTAFNAGNAETKGLTIVTYAGALLTDAFSLDLAYGRSFLDTDQFRTNNATRITSDLESERAFFAGNLNYSRTLGAWNVLGRVGAIWLRDSQDAFSESDGTAVAQSDFRVGRAKIGGEVSRMFGRIEPFANLTYNWSFTQTQPTAGGSSQDRKDALLGIGARYYGEDSLSGTVEFTHLFGRDNVDEYSINLLLRTDF